MQSLNFETLRPRYPELANLGAIAEQYVHSEPASACVKLRAFGEILTGAIYSYLRLRRPGEDEFVKLLTNWPFKNAVPPAVLNALHALRKEGNQGAHGNPVTTETAIWLLEESIKLGHWWSVEVLKIPIASFPPFQMPPKHPLVPAAKLAELENELAEKVKALEELQRTHEQVAQQAEQLVAVRAESQQTADLLHINENDTRQYLISRDLTRAGWKVGHKGAARAEVTQEQVLKTGDRAETFGEPIRNPKGWPKLRIGQLGLVVTGNTPRLEPTKNTMEAIWSGSSPTI
jgi:type I restriction enzyme R subunit